LVLKPKTVLIVDDEVKIVEAVEAYLKNSGYITLVSFDGRDALEKFDEFNPDMVILDIMLPFISGETICKKIREKSRVPVIMLTAKVHEDDKIRGLVIGADDYITKPFSPRELVARVDSLFRRYNEFGISPLFNRVSWNNGDLSVDFDSYTIKKQGATVNVTPNEFKIFATLVKHPNKAYSREELIDQAFGMDFDGFSRTIDSHVKNLRAKIEGTDTEPVYILTVRGIGYKFGGVVDEKFVGDS
jgi:DNA-binding response OmpR family regulator